MSKENNFQPDYTIHPGEYLQEIIDARNLTKVDIAHRLDVHPTMITNITKGKKSIGPELAIKLEHVIGVSRNIWNNLNSSYQLSQAKQNEKEQLDQYKDWANSFPLNFLKELSFIPATQNYQKIVLALLEFFNISEPEVWDKYYGTQTSQLRESLAYECNQKPLATWIRAGEKFVEETIYKPYDKKLFKENLNKIKQLTREEPSTYIPKMKELCREAGVALTFVPEPKGISVYGGTKWMNKDTPLIIQSLRRKSNDHFWFTFFHEAGHILRHGKKEVFIYNDENESQKEDEADRFARKFLVDTKEYQKFVKNKKITQSSIQNFAYEQNLDPGIIVGFLQHDEQIKYSWHNGLKKKIDFEKLDIDFS